jgi:hypothetical protein
MGERIDITGLASIINSRLAADSRVAIAAAFGWLGGGIAIASVLTGLGIACALIGQLHTFG